MGMMRWLETDDNKDENVHECTRSFEPSTEEFQHRQEESMTESETQDENERIEQVTTQLKDTSQET